MMCVILRRRNRSESLATGLAIAVALFACIREEANAQNGVPGFVELNVYPYLGRLESDSAVTINTSSVITDTTSYFSMLNMYGQKGQDGIIETNHFYTEQNLRFSPIRDSGLQLTYQANFRSDDGHDRHRFGLRYGLHTFEPASFIEDTLNAAWHLNFHLLQYDTEPGRSWQIEQTIVMKFPWVTERLYLVSVTDLTFNNRYSEGGRGTNIVSESQIGFRAFDNLYLVAEYRYTDYREEYRSNLAAGAEYKIRF